MLALVFLGRRKLVCKITEQEGGGQLSVSKTGVEISTGTFLDHLVHSVLYQRVFFFIKLIQILYVDHCCSSGNLVLEARSSKTGRWPFWFCVFMFSPCHEYWLQSECGLSYFFKPPLCGEELLEVIYVVWKIFSQFSSVQLLSCVRLFATPWTVACQASMSVTNSPSLLKLMSIESVMPSNHLILCHPFFLSPAIFSSIRVFSNDSALHHSLATSGGVSASASVLPVNTQDWSPLGWTGWISLQSKGLSRVFSNTTVQKHQFFGAQLSL